MAKKIFLFFGMVILALVYVFIDYLGYKSRCAPVLMYHGVGNDDGKNWGDMLIRPQLFQEQIKYLADRGYRIVSVEELADLFRTNESVEKVIGISFDDGYANNYEYAFPILKKFHGAATFYLIRNAIGANGYMNDKQVKEMIRAGMKIGSHSMSHSNLTVIDKSFLRNELTGSKMLLGQRYEDIVVESVSYPNGAYNGDVIEAAVAAGYLEGVTGIYGVNTLESFNDNPFEMRRIGIYDQGGGVGAFSKTIEMAYFTGYMRFRGVNLVEIKKKLLEFMR